MTDLYEIVSFLDEYLRINEFPDKSRNGLQVEGKSEVERIAFAVDASMETFERANKWGADLLIVHHGLIWGGIEYVRGLIQRRLKFLLQNELNLYAAHLPLDAHPEVGNNAQLLKLLGLEPKEPFGSYGGISVGYVAEFEEPKHMSFIAQTLAEKLDTNVKAFEFGREEVKSVAVVSGGGGFATVEAIEKGIDLFITGEFLHQNFHMAKEGGLNVIAAGHYATETLGVKSLMPLLKEKFGVEVLFIDAPTGL
ncbi:hypothetical protein PAP_09585 [Palaeococcus pacificus DY20341]|uniref:Nif3-like dinuclear metal center hexameric protein n=1 Tax=Palaeococcus pacificus DY20341 TaxID=1343739 RepID=A0A075LW83_9EURY|nr:Nif3-like dinuclear metal center hexameric protein [Palaeococcus pacificus]AIF70292.1 hypothetical protein PAP_09585 [Palaeococcus pacificus DY20341]